MIKVTSEARTTAGKCSFGCDDWSYIGVYVIHLPCLIGSFKLRICSRCWEELKEAFKKVQVR